MKDLAQYPVFPWVLADYSSSVLDLKDPKFFRDLSRPIGVQSASQLALATREYELKLRSRNRAEEATPYHYDTHYSTPSHVINFLFRCEPFTSLLLQMEGGVFSSPENMFTSFEHAYRAATTDFSQIKELVPEFFCCPEVLINVNSVDFGGDNVCGDVQLPAWAKSPYDFVCKHRQALECEIVSENLHLWIDLIF